MQSGCHSSSADDDKSIASGLLSPDALVASARSKGSAHAKNPVRTNKWGIDIPVQAETLGDIEACGGLNIALASKHGMRNFCNAQQKDNVHGSESTANAIRLPTRFGIGEGHHTKTVRRHYLDFRSGQIVSMRAMNSSSSSHPASLQCHQPQARRLQPRKLRESQLLSH